MFLAPNLLSIVWTEFYWNFGFTLGAPLREYGIEGDIDPRDSSKYLEAPPINAELRQDTPFYTLIISSPRRGQAGGLDVDPLHFSQILFILSIQH